MIMVPTFDAIKGGGGSVGIGATGTISSLMNRELASGKRSPQSPKSTLRRSPTIPVSVPCVSRLKRQQRPMVNEATTSGSSKKAHSVPMLGSDDIVVDNSLNRKKTDKKVSYIEEVVDIKCGSHEKPWSNSITHKLRKLSFSKLSQSII